MFNQGGHRAAKMKGSEEGTGEEIRTIDRLIHVKMKKLLTDREMTRQLECRNPDANLSVLLVNCDTKP